jgi:L-serine dehydratase
MRGPSSSHSAAALRIGRMARDLMEGELDQVVVDYDPNGSLVTTHESQGSDLGLFGGLMGWETDDERLPDFREQIGKAGINVEIRYLSYGAVHPNTYRLSLKNRHGEQHMTAVSIGGGMIEIQEINGAKVSMQGDYFELLVFVSEGAEGLANWLRSDFQFEDVITTEGSEGALIEVKSRCHPDQDLLEELRANASVSSLCVLEPVLPVLARSDMSVPFINGVQMQGYRDEHGGAMSLGELGARYEAQRGGITEEEVRSRMAELIGVMEQSIRVGLGGTEYADRILPCQSVNFGEKMDKGELVPGDVLNRVILYVTAMMEMKSSMGVIVAAPTAGSCGALPGALLAVADALGKDTNERVEAMLAAGMIGVFIAEEATFAAEEAGCMAECGSGASMGAAGIVSLAGGSYDQQIGAASMALQNSLGMTCDTLANRVEAPCLGRNVTAASNALSSANMALADFQHLVPIDQVIVAMREVGELMPREICCTGLGGLAVTPASREIAKKLKDAQEEPVAAEGKVETEKTRD